LIPYRVEDGNTVGNNITVTVASDASPVVNVSTTTSGNDRTLTISPFPNASGTDTITVQATDGTFTATETFTVTVTPVNDPPIISGLVDATVPANRTLVRDFSVFDVESDPLTVNATVSDPSFGTVAVTGAGFTRTLTFTPSGPQGNVSIAVTASDGAVTATNTVLVTVTPPIVPSITDIGDVITDENVPVTVPFEVFIPDVDATNVVVTPTIVGAPVIITLAFSGTGEERTLTITPLQNQIGTNEVTLTISAPGNTNAAATTFLVVVRNVDDDPPVIGAIADQEVRTDGVLVLTVPLSDPDTALTDLTFIASAANGTSVVQNVTVNLGTSPNTLVIRVTPQPAVGSDTVTIAVFDGLNLAEESFVVTVVPGAQCVVLGPIANQTGAPGAVLRVPLDVTDPDTAFTDLQFQLEPGNGTPVVQSASFEQTATSVTAVITLRSDVADGASGTATIHVLDGNCAVVSQSFTITIEGVPPAATLSASRQGSNFVLNVTGQVGSTYAIEATSDFRSWTQIGTVTIEADGTTTVTLPISGSFRFFQVRSGPPEEQAAALAYEGFGYAAGTTLSTNVNGGTGWTAGWTPDAENAATNHLVLEGGMEFGDGVRALVTSPGSLFMTATTNNMASGDVRGFRTIIGGVRSNGVSWISFIGQRMGPTVTNTGTPNNPYPRAANLSFYEGGSERFAIGNGSGAVSNLWSILPAGSVGNAGVDQRSSTPMSQQAFIVIRVNHIGDATVNDDLYMWVNPPLGATPDISTASARSVGGFNFSFDRIRPFVGGNDAGNNRPYAEMGLDEIRVGDTFASVTPTVQDVTQPFNAVVLVSGTDTDTSTNAPPAAEGVERVIDNAGQKYLNFLEFDSGFIVTPLGSTVVNGLRLWTANDAVDRDPASYKLEGSTAGASGPWTLISEGPLNLPAGRNAGGATTALRGGLNQIVRFNNTTAYTSYRVTFPTVKNSTAANSMQISEVDFLSYP
jgi:hypothetical protein